MKSPSRKTSVLITSDGNATALAGFIAGAVCTLLILTVVLYFTGQFIDLSTHISL